MPNPTRREREEVLIAHHRGGPCAEEIAAALESAHRREDAIRNLTRFDRDMDSTMMADEYGDYVRYDDLRDILNADDAPQGGA